MRWTQCVSSGAIAALAALSGPGAMAQAPAGFPSKPITIVVPFPPGANADSEARVYQQGLGARLKRPVLVDNKAGAAGIIANNYVAKAAPDGHTMLFTNATTTILPALRKDLPYDLLRDFTPVTMTTKNIFVLLAAPNFPASTFGQFIAMAKARPGEVTWSTVGLGSALHMIGEWLGSAAGVKFNFVHYKGGGAAEADLLAGRINVTPKNLSPSLPLIKAGKVRVLAIVTDEPTPVLPDVRTATAMGYPDFKYSAWIGLVAPAGTPSAIVDYLQTEVAAAIKTPEALRRWERQGSVAVGSSPGDFRRHLVAELAVWDRIVRENNIKAK